VNKNHERLFSILRYIGPKKQVCHFPKIAQVLVWELMKAHTRINKLEKRMMKYAVNNR